MRRLNIHMCRYCSVGLCVQHSELWFISMTINFCYFILAHETCLYFTAYTGGIVDILW